MVNDQPTKKPIPAWRTTLMFDEMTWGALRHLLKVAEYKSDDDEVFYEWDESEMIPARLGITLYSEPPEA